MEEMLIAELKNNIKEMIKSSQRLPKKASIFNLPD